MHASEPGREASPAGLLGDKYEVVRELGRGGMAVVYLARERATGHEWAVKVMHGKFADDDEAVARFEREARLVAQLQHPHVVPIHAVEWLGGAGVALVMDCVRGRTVKQIIRDDGAMPFDQVERVLDDIAGALGYAHAQGVVHRDVKPENIFIDETTGRALLSDFGIARSIDGDTQLTLTGAAIGTPTYMAPEQIDGGAIDARSDLYSLGVVGWEMLTGQRPWSGETLYQVIYRQKHDDLPAIDALRPDTPPRLLAAVEGLLEKSPSKRWQSTDDFRARLLGVAPAERRVRVRRVDTSSAETVVFQPPSRGRVRGLVARSGPVGVAAALLISATLVFAWPSAPWTGARDGPVREATAPTGAAPRPARRAIRGASPAAGFASASAGLMAPVVGSDTMLAAGGAATPYDSSAAGVAAPSNTGEQLTQSAPTRPPLFVSPDPIATAPAAAPMASVAQPAPAVSAPPVAVAPAPPTRRTARRYAIVPGVAHTCMLSPAGSLYCWGGNAQGQLGAGGTADAARSTMPVGGGARLRFTQVALGPSSTCALTGAGAAYCWGANDHGQLGDGSTTSHTSPVRVAGGRAFTQIVTGAAHSCGLTDAGQVYCWGRGASGRLGTGEAVDRATPAPVAGSVRFTELVTGWNHTCALTDDGKAYCWGENSMGELGDGGTTDRLAPAPVRTGARFVALAGGSAHTCGITASGAAYCWGQNRYGQLGSGAPTEAQLTPVAVRSTQRFVGISAGAVHTCAVTSSNEAWCWGRNAYGQLGDGSATDRAAPVRVSGGHDFVSVTAFGAHSCGTTATDELFCWGYNLEGQLGDGTREHRFRPVYVEKPAE